MYRVYIHHGPGPEARLRLAAMYQLRFEPRSREDAALGGGSYVSATTLADARSIVEKLRTLLVGDKPVTCEVIRDGGFFEGNGFFADGSASPGRRPASGGPRG